MQYIQHTYTYILDIYGPVYRTHTHRNMQYMQHTHLDTAAVYSSINSSTAVGYGPGYSSSTAAFVLGEHRQQLVVVK